MKTYKAVQVFITTKKSRIKVYNNNICYLKPGQQFEIQFNNNTDCYYLAMISLNGKEISKMGLVIRPYEHTYLDRYIDENCRFLFSNIRVSKSNEHNVGNLGQIKVVFYKQIVKKLETYKLKTYPYWDYYPKYYVGDFPEYNLTTTDSTSEYIYCSYNNCLDSNTSVNYLNNSMNNIIKKDSNIIKGIIQRGDQSSTQFEQSHEQFKDCPQFQIIYKLQPIQNKTIDNITYYCNNCGRRIRQSENFCPKCGNKN